MKRKNFFILIIMIIWIGMLVRTFFWWNPTPTNNTDIPKYETSWFIEELTNTWNILDTWDILTIPDSEKEYTVTWQEFLNLAADGINVVYF